MSGSGRGRHGRGRGAERAAGGRSGELGGFPARQTVGFTVPQGPARGTGGGGEPNRMQFASNVSLGSTATVTLKSGESVEGIFMGTRREAGDVSFALGDVKPAARDGTTPPPQPFRAEAMFPGADVVSVCVANVDLSGNSVSSNGSAATTQQLGGFTTDTDISAAAQKQLMNRELQPWMPDEGDMALEGLSSAAGPKQPGGGKWDQFEANQRQFGVQTSFNEDLYTTKLDRKRAGISEKEAARIAREIEGGKTSNPHLAEERGQIAYRELDQDEEARYSAVARGGAAGAGVPSFDTRNDETFGFSTSTKGENGRAWSSAAGSVAAVTGRGSSASSASLGRSAPIDMDPRREHNKVRMQLAGSQGKERSPYGTPKSGRSPLDSPLVGNASQVEALDLNVGGAKYDPDVRSEFKKWKQARRQDSFSPSTESELAKAPSASVASFADSIPPSPKDTSPPSQGQQAAGGDESRGQDQQPPRVPPRRQPVLSLPAKGPSTGTQTPLSFGSMSLAESDEAAASQAGPPPNPPAAARPSAQQAVPGATLPPASKPPLKQLNPNAPEFKLRPTAAVFVPGGGTPALSRAASTASSAVPPPPVNSQLPRPAGSTEAPGAVPHGQSGGPLGKPSGQRFAAQGQGQGMGRVLGSAGPRGEPRAGGRSGGGRNAREGLGRGPPGSPKSRGFERQVQSARPHGMGGPFSRPPEAMSHQMQQQMMQQHSQMMQQQQMMGAHMMMSPPHMGGPGMPGPQVPPYEMSSPSRPPFSQPGMAYNPHAQGMHPGMHPGGHPMFASPPYPPGAHPMMSPPNGQPMFPPGPPPFPPQGMAIYPQHPMQVVPQYPGPGNRP